MNVYKLSKKKKNFLIFRKPHRILTALNNQKKNLSRILNHLMKLYERENKIPLQIENILSF